ncbi:MAG TPA: ATP-binding protein [Steroidobacteraceae bacterium]
MIAPERSPVDLTAGARAERLEWLLQGLLEVQSLITEQGFDLDTFMQRVVDLAQSLTDASGAVVELVDAEDMVYRRASGSMRGYVGLRLGRAGSLSGLCVAQARVLRCDDTEEDARVDRVACRKVGARSMICTPLFRAGRAIGVLKVAAAKPHAFDANEEQLLTLLAGSLGAALGNHVALEALRTSEETFRCAMENASIGMALITPQGRFLKVNAALCELLGYDEAHLLANDFQSITHPEDLPADLQLVQQALSGQIDRYRMEKRCYHKSGRTIWTLLSVTLVRDRAGAPSYFVAQIQDISEQREIERVKNEFVSVVSHELRTPLTSIRGSLGLMLGTMSSEMPRNAGRLLEIAHVNCERLIVLINDILDIDKIASGHMRFDMQRRSVAELIRRSVQMTESYAQRFDARLEIRAIVEDAWIVVDEDRFAQVLLNLLSNASKFSPPKGIVSVDIRVAQDRVRIGVTDEGPGIADDFRARIFERFSQADSSITRRTGGTGLGLHISRQIVERMNGTIGFDTQMGRGSTFWVEFPLAARHVEAAVAAPIPQAVGQEIPAVLHLEQDAGLVEVLSAGLNERAHLVPAPTLRQAEALLRQRDFALLIADIALPDATGLEVLDRLETLVGERMPILILCNDAPAADVSSRVAAVMVKTRTTEEKIVATILQTIEQAARRSGL